MPDRIEAARHRVLLEASLQTKAEWTVTVRAFYTALLTQHPRLALYFKATDIELQVQKLVDLLSMIAREMPDHDTLDRLLLHTGCSHVTRGIGRAEFADFIALLANILADTAPVARREATHSVWFQELLIVADAMLLTAPD